MKPRWAALAVLLMLVKVASGAVLQVGAQQSIAAAIGAAQPGDTLRIGPGSYAGNFIIDKPL
ncbi:MAG: nitrous oxide reductase family maturation protein NosD, partial [Telluria sp.]